MKYRLVSILVVFVAVIGFVTYTRNTSNQLDYKVNKQPHAVDLEKHDSTMFIPESLMEKNDTPSSLGIARQRTGRNGDSLFTSDEQFRLAREQSFLFSPLPVQQIPHLMDSIDQRRKNNPNYLWFKYDNRVLFSRAKNDSFMLALPNQLMLEAKIDEVEILPPNQYRWSGHFTDTVGGTFSITQTSVDEYAVGKVSYGGEEFLLESSKGVGWIVNALDEFQLPAGGKDFMYDEHQ